MSETKHPGGRPLKFKTLQELDEKITYYFDNTPKDEWTITGLALALDTSRKVLIDYEDKDEYSYTIKRAKLMVENGYEIDLKKNGRSGTIFALKNFDWQDKTEIEHSGEINRNASEEELDAIIARANQRQAGADTQTK